MKRIKAIQLTTNEWHDLLRIATDNGFLIGVTSWKKWVDSIEFAENIDGVLYGILNDESMKQRMLNVLGIQEIIDIDMAYEMDRITCVYETEEVKADWY